MSTKIINVLRDDKIEDILDIFKKTPAREVIFVMPKRSLAFDEEESFSLLAQEAQERGKSVLMLASDPGITELALKYDFGVLATAPKSNNKPEKMPVDNGVNLQPENEDDNIKNKSADGEVLDSEVTEDESGSESEQIEPRGLEAVEFESGDVNYLRPFLVSATKKTKPISDIVDTSAQDAKNIQVSKKTEKEIKVQINTDFNHEEIVSRPEDLIKPDPKREQSISDQIQNVWQSKRGEDNFKISRPTIQSGRYLKKLNPSRLHFSFKKRIVTIFGALSVVILGTVLYVSMGNAKILIKPQNHVLDIQKVRVSISDKFSSSDLETKKIPGQFFSLDKRVEKTFSATGEKDVVQKARGIITVYNEYGTTPQILIATTRFESEGGLIFRTLKTITVPGTKVQNGEIIPGKIDVEVIADKAGNDYNIGAGNFKIPAFKEKGDLDRYGKFYGKSTAPIKGGIIGKAKVITEQDYIKAKEDVQKMIIDEIKKELNIQSAGLEFLRELQPELGEFNSSGQIDEATDEFTVEVTASLKNIAFKKNDLYDLISAFVKKTNDFEVFPEKLNIQTDNVRVDVENHLIEFDLSFSGSAYSKINSELIIDDLMGKNEGQIKEYIVGRKDISSAKVVLSPFWVRKVPKYKDRVSVELQYE